MKCTYTLSMAAVVVVVTKVEMEVRGYCLGPELTARRVGGTRKEEMQTTVAADRFRCTGSEARGKLAGRGLGREPKLGTGLNLSAHVRQQGSGGVVVRARSCQVCKDERRLWLLEKSKAEAKRDSGGGGGVERREDESRSERQTGAPEGLKTGQKPQASRQTIKREGRASVSGHRRDFVG